MLQDVKNWASVSNLADFIERYSSPEEYKDWFGEPFDSTKSYDYEHTDAFINHAVDKWDDICFIYIEDGKFEGECWWNIVWFSDVKGVNVWE